MRPTHEGLFHVFARSNAEDHIFRDDRDYLDGIQIVASLVRSGFFRCHGFCFMPTHYHLLATFPDGGLTPAIHRLNRRYASGFNRRHGRRGKVFDTPFGTTSVERPEHGEYLPEYIAENPPYRPWPWSSFDNDFSFVEPLPWVRNSRP